MGHQLDEIFNPRSIAVAGASPDPKNRGNEFLAALVEQGFKGPIYAVHPRAQDVLGNKGYASVLDIPGPVDYVISSIPASASLQLLDECGRKGVRAIHFFTARFGETGHQDLADLEQELKRRAEAGNVRILGPNCMGLYYPGLGVSFHPWPHESGKVGALSQSGGNLMELVYGVTHRGARFSKAVSYGNALDINETDLMEYFADDTSTEVIGAYLEGVRDGRGFVKAVSKAASRKPVVLLKGGRTDAGTRAVASHTASLAGSRQVWQALARQTGAILVSSMEELTDMMVAFNYCPPGTGMRVGVSGGGGGRAVESADACEEAGLIVEPIPPAMRAEFHRRYSEVWGDWISNPVDNSIMGGTDVNLQDILELMAKDPHYDMLIVNVGEGRFMHKPDKESNSFFDSLDKTLEIAKGAGKPVALVMGDTVSEFAWQVEFVMESRKRINAVGMATFPTVRRAAQALFRLAGYYRQASEAGR